MQSDFRDYQVAPKSSLNFDSGQPLPAKQRPSSLSAGEPHHSRRRVGSGRSGICSRGSGGSYGNCAVAVLLPAGVTVVRTAPRRFRCAHSASWSPAIVLLYRKQTLQPLHNFAHFGLVFNVEYREEKKRYRESEIARRFRCVKMREIFLELEILLSSSVGRNKKENFVAPRGVVEWMKHAWLL